MQDVPHRDLVADIEAFCATYGFSLSGFGKASVGDRSFVTTLKNGRECRRATLGKVRSFMAQVRSRNQSAA